jgi:aminopeptidase N
MKEFIHIYQEDQKIALVEFEQTPQIAPYLYALCAGPYKKIEQNYHMLDKKIEIKNYSSVP